MNISGKHKLINFLDLAEASLLSGYKRARNEILTKEEPEQNTEKTINKDVSQKQNLPDTIESIAAEIEICKNCRLSESRKNAAAGEGSLSPLVLVIGEGPGHDEDLQGRPFVGKAGQLLDKMLSSIHLSRETNCFIANVVKCRPPDNRDPHPNETEACGGFLQRQIKILKPKIILLVGYVASQTILNTKEKFGSIRGKFFEYNTGDSVIPLFVTFHPAALLRNENFKRPAWEDLKLLRERIDQASSDPIKPGE